MSEGEIKRPLAGKAWGPDRTESEISIAARCEHQHQRQTVDRDIAVCAACGRIVGALSRAGEIELIALSVRWGGEPGEIGGGGDDYGIRVAATTDANAPVKPERNGHEKKAKWGAVAV